MKTKYLFGALMAVMATSCTAKTNEPAAPQSGKTMPDQSLLSAIRTNSGNSPCPVPSRGILCSLFSHFSYCRLYSIFFNNYASIEAVFLMT